MPLLLIFVDYGLVALTAPFHFLAIFTKPKASTSGNGGQSFSSSRVVQCR
jgi:hypothetical protein